MEKQINKIIVLIFFFTFSYAQSNIQTKEYSIYKNATSNYVDISDYIQGLNGDYQVDLINLTDLNFQVKKNIILQQCELEFSISSDIDNNIISVKKCSDNFLFSNTIKINNNNSKILFNGKNVKYLSGVFTFWITGKFDNDNYGYEALDDGVLREWYDDGSLYIEYNFENGKKNGKQKRWHQDGTPAIEYIFRNGKLNGEQKNWHDNGNIKSIIYYKNHILDGISKEWYPNGQLKYVKIYENGNLKNILESYDVSGKSNLNDF